MFFSGAGWVVPWGRMMRVVMVLVAWQMACSAASTDGVCGSIDIRNSVKNLQRLSGCRVIEGFLQVVLMDLAVPSDFQGVSFPELREVTEFVIFYRVSGLSSIGQLFPNLSVIRGDELFLDYALSIVQMPYLRDIGLVSLTTILRGSVAITSNPGTGLF